jgi:nucleoside-triphosphatase THEP1
VEVGNTLVTLDEGGGEPTLMRDGSAIQSFIAERHGAQRQRLGFDAEQLRREYGHLMAIVHDAVQRFGTTAGSDVDAIQRIVARLLRRAESISLDGHSRRLPR